MLPSVPVCKIALFMPACFLLRCRSWRRSCSYCVRSQIDHGRDMTQPSRRSFFSRFGRWIAELLLVFVGVYAAFWLNNYQERQRDAKRRDVILASLEESVKQALDIAQSNAVIQEKR